MTPQQVPGADLSKSGNPKYYRKVVSCYFFFLFLAQSCVLLLFSFLFGFTKLSVPAGDSRKTPTQIKVGEAAQNHRQGKTCKVARNVLKILEIVAEPWNSLG